MKIPRQQWPHDPAKARDLQDRLRARVVREDHLGPVHTVAGADASYRTRGEFVQAAVCVMTFPDLNPQTTVRCRRPMTFPYVPGLLSFREAPAVLGALRRLAAVPDLLLVDGQGIAHPRRFGIACHIGVAADIPAIGVAKSRLIGTYAEPGNKRGSWSPLLDQGEQIGAVVRTRTGTLPLFVSVGHRINLATAVEYVLRCASRYRLPEPIREADRLSRLWMKRGS